MTDQETMDLLVVGGGPAGLAAALRGHELGLKLALLEADDLMRRIRDYSKDKLILPGFGGGDHMRFPDGGSLVKRMAFGPIDKDDLCALYRELRRDSGINVHVGVELLGLTRLDSGEYQARVFDHRTRMDGTVVARHVALALGRGVPRRFDIPGDTEGIAFRLEDARSYVGHPACVIGGGTSAAEAVIAISNAKRAARDNTEVHWSYRGDRLPRVSKALAEVFFEAYAGNGNIRYHPRSEPLMIGAGDDRRQYLLLRLDRRIMDGRPVETTVLEFAKEQCLACIGEDLPEELLASFGIRMVVGRRGKKRMVVNRYLETELPNVYLMGDILSQAHLEADDFTADPKTFKETRHRGNIKAALRDGVLVAQVVKQRLDGVEDVDLDVGEIADPEPPEEGTNLISVDVMDETPDVPHASPAPKTVEKPAAWLVGVLPGGMEEEERPLAAKSVTSIGRRDCDISFPDDTLMSKRHASIAVNDNGVVLRDDGSANGVFLKVRSDSKSTLIDGDLLRAGRQFLLVRKGKKGFSLVHYDAKGRELGQHTLNPGTIIAGRKAPDLTLDANDGTLSRRQLVFTVDEETLLVKDLASANGTFLRVRDSVRLRHGDGFQVGRQRFLLSLRQDPVFDAAHQRQRKDRASSSEWTEAGSSAALKREAPTSGSSASMAAAPWVVFQPSGERFPVLPGQTLCEVAEANGVQISAECHAGVCGSDPIRIISGRENLESPPDDGEAETLEELCELEPGPCRLACMARIKGPVEVEIL